MADKGVAVVDVNFFEFLKWIDSDCSLTEFIIERFGPSAVGDRVQLQRMDYCESMKTLFSDHGISDEELMAWIMDTKPQIAEILRKHLIVDDLVDAKLLRYAVREDNATLLACDAKLLIMAEKLEVPHYCFKAALAETDTFMNGGIFDDPDYQTAKMERGGEHPFFHYGNDKHCPRCDVGCQCRHRKDGALVA